MGRTKDKRKKVSARKTAERNQGGYESNVLQNVPDDLNFYKFKAGRHQLEILCFEAGEGNPECEPGDIHFERTFYTHRNVGVNRETFICPAKTFGKKCPICEYRAKRAEAGAGKEELKSLNFKRRQLWLVHDAKEGGDNLYLWDVSFHLFGEELFDAINNSDEADGYEFFADPEDGLTLKVFAEDKVIGEGRPFVSTKRIDFADRQYELSDELIERAEKICLDDLLKEVPYAKLKSIFEEEDTGGDKDEEEESRRSRRSRRDEGDEEGKSSGRQRRRSRDDDEGEDKDEGKSSGRRRSRRSRSDDDEGDEDEKKEEKKDTPTTADEAGLEVDDKVEHDDLGLCSILRISRDGTSLTLEDEDGKKHRAIGCDEVSKVKEKTSSKKTSKKGGDEQECPDPEGTFGKDTDELEACNDCPLWDACDDAKYSD